MKKKLTIVVLLFLTEIIFSENIYFFTRTTFADSQFWEKNNKYNSNGDLIDSRRVFANFLTGSIGAGVEMVIWDIGKKRGSRIYFKGGIDVLFMGPTYFGIIEEDNGIGSIIDRSLNGGAFYTGFDFDLFVGGTFPKTDLLWGFGSIFHFTFPAYSPVIGVENFKSGERFAFYAAPSLLLGYDIFIPYNNFKITPQIRVGLTCLPLIPDDLIGDMNNYNLDKTDMYSGLYIDFSVAFSFYAIQWKK